MIKMIFLKKLPFLLLLMTLLFSCSERKHIKDYYYPVKVLEEKGGQVYEYVSVGDIPLGPIYWYFYTSREGKTRYLNGVYFEANFIPLQIIKEEIVKTGVLLDELAIMTSDSTGKMVKKEGEVLVATVFPFSVIDSGGVFLYKVKIDFPEEGYTATLIKNRYFAGDSVFTFNNTLYDCVKFEVNELIEYGNEKEGYTEPGFSGEEFYAKSIGLVHYKKKTEKGDFMEYTLRKRYPLSEANSFLKQALIELGVK